MHPNRCTIPGARFRVLLTAVMAISLAAIFLSQDFVRPEPVQAAPEFNAYMSAARDLYGITDSEIGTVHTKFGD